MGWEDCEQTLLLQCVFCGKAQKAYSTISVRDSQVYSKVKYVVLKAYELVPEAYRQWFQTLRKGMQQPFTDFARELRIQLLIVGARFHKQMIVILFMNWFCTNNLKTLYLKHVT